MADRRILGQWSFNGGELSPRLQSRVDQNVYQIALAEMVGWLPLLQGPAITAPGTHFVEEAAGPCRLFPFEYSSTQGYVIEGSANKFRFYTNDARIETSPGVAYELAHGYSHDELLELDHHQSADVLYLAGANLKPKKLSRTSATSFAISDLDLQNGPIDIGNGDEDKTITVSGTLTVGGTVTITASEGIFAPTDEGRLMEIEAKDFGDIKSWEPGYLIAFHDKRTWGGRVYWAVDACEGFSEGADRTGGVPPEHDSGSEWDGSASGEDINAEGPFGIKWEYLYNRYGLVRITNYVSATQVQAVVIKRLADSLGATATHRWAFGAFSDTSGWPDTVGLWGDCLVLTKGNKGYVSVVGDYENFGRRDGSGDFQRDLAGGFTLPKAAKIQWQASDRHLLLGTETDEYTIERVQIQTGTPGPPVFEIKLQSSNGSKRAKPIQADGRMLFLQRAGRKLREMGYAISSDRYQAPDMTRLADHVGAAGFVELAWQQEPERLAWAVLGDGTLAAMTYDPDQQVMGWCRRQLGGGMTAKSACRITDPEGLRDQIWLAVENEAGTAHWILRMAKVWESGDDQADAFLVDAGLSYDGAPATVFSGLDHLNGMDVDILADGKPHRQLTVAGGQVTLDYAASKVHIGHNFLASFTTLVPSTGPDAAEHSNLKRVLGLRMQVIEAQGLRVSVQGGTVIPVETRGPDDPMDAAVPLYSGLIHIPTIGRYDRLGQVTVERYQPTPATVVSMIPLLETGDA